MRPGLVAGPGKIRSRVTHWLNPFPIPFHDQNAHTQRRRRTRRTTNTKFSAWINRRRRKVSDLGLESNLE
ncbi:hypothetical protein RHMOL_Rhmol06G0109800 [Rhododendron molle]|uniref:Uncharacterized protein n=1 Tax=Rhododendron molle TaxID=49168 RepID=A0ACC0NDB2_RHOML|nr:hypothetical protein RHMOL_Rhmol06G0109800 [Rhododendron molle]